MFKRVHLEIIKERIKEQRKFIQVVTGPRQVGKTTMIMQFLQEIAVGYVFEAADSVVNSNAAWLRQVWETARLQMKAFNAKEYLLIKS